MDKFGINLLWASRYDYEMASRLQPHLHDYYQIIYFLSGAGVFTCDGAEYPIESGTLFFIQPKRMHGFVPRVHEANKNKTLDLKFRIHDNQLIDEVKKLPTRHKDTTTELKSLLERIRKEGERKALFYGETACLCLVQLLYMLCRNTSEGDSGKPEYNSSEVGQKASEPTEAAKRVEHYLGEHYNESLTLQLVAERTCYSKNYVSQMIKHNFGCSFTHYLQNLRVEQSKVLILYSSLSLKQIAENVGFKTIQHFNRVFKQVEGISPGQWKHREMNGICKDIVFD
ncbi:AraC family transcriptional regulator [Paenibacillus sp. EC2-1]|uniref:AraC family transcriptional regulator n=1 Tax=Paenibacillus sp. EC2-1 TaxID=3388665 RepID=UPI003BEF1CCD